MVHREVGRQREIFENAMSKVDFTEQGLRKAWRLLEKLQDGTLLQKEEVRKPILVEHPEGERLLKLRNPWGRTEWEGRWGDADMARPENARMRAKLGWKKEDDGIFWIGWQDFVQYFRSVSICMLPARWHCASAQGEWAGATAGGCPNYDSTADSC